MQRRPVHAWRMEDPREENVVSMASSTDASH
eukprot:CAMPEP_0181197388 /NCGR_PEP_ID=MMETSP1096-20121128/16011_1 /TAXON_ID=156174 ORGANISM="Chrysochromulina ericina, Strain CCMP281" /NCGR_SAMPLE_ID=MMETSP1096 /ASSEMBLY_ACC=CAM_ASM_000453 /LENGTH=30 /DNA_ID= /DNA_START= /DNA_END= /DNA_ORIENTATION=